MIARGSPDFQTVLRHSLLRGLAETLPIQHVLHGTSQSLQLQDAHDEKTISALNCCSVILPSFTFNCCCFNTAGCRKRPACVPSLYSQTVYLIRQVTREVAALPGEELIVQLSQASAQHVFPTEQRMMGENQTGDVYIKLEVPLGVCCNVQAGALGHEGLEE